MRTSFLIFASSLIAIGAVCIGLRSGYIANVAYALEDLTRSEISVENPPLVPDTAREQAEPPAETNDDGAVDESLHAIEAAASAVAAATDPTDYPVELQIPSIHLVSPIQQVGLNSKGEMDVPDGNTNKVGWYKYGTVPGQIGSSVLDAHVYAAFSKLKYLKTGDSIYIRTKNGNTLHFQVEETQYYRLSAVPAVTLFNRSDARRLNLITCAGSLTKDRSTYDHRLIVYTKLVE